MPATLTRPARKPVTRTKKTSGATPVCITNVSVMGAGLTLTFDQPVLLRGTPKISTDVAGAVAVSALRQAPNRIMILYSSSLAGARLLNLTYRDPAIRNTCGGYLTSNRFVFDF